MQTYKLRKEKFSELRNRMLVRTIPLGIIALTIGLGMFYFDADNSDNKVSVLLFMVPFCVGAFGFGISKSLIRQKTLFESYTLSISQSKLIREQYNTPIITIPFTDISAIIKNTDNSFIIKGSTAVAVICVPAQISESASLERVLSEIYPMTVKTKELLVQKLQLPITLLTLGLMAIVYVATNKILVGISGTIVSGFMIWSFFQIQRNQSVDRQTKRSSYAVVMVTISLIVITIYKVLVN